MVKIIADSTSDLLPKDALCHAIVPLTLYTDEKSFLDNEDLDVSGMLTYLTNYREKSHTSCPSTGEWLKAFGDTDGDEIYVITMTSGLSGTYNSALAAKEIYEEQYPNSKVRVFDSLSIGPEMRLAIEKLTELLSSGETFEEICALIDEYLAKARLFFTLNSLENLAKNGRVSKVVASAFGFFGISLVGIASEEGTIEPLDKCRGEKKLIASIMKQLEAVHYNGGKVRICHVENPGLADKVVSKIKEIYGDVDAMFYEARGICSFYAEKGGLILGCECC